MATSWQTNPSFAAGGICRAADLNTLSSNMLLVGKVPMIQMFTGTAQTIPNDNDTAISFSSTYTATESIDRADPADSSGMHSTSTNPTQVKPTIAGWWLVSGQVCYAVNSTGVREARIYKNGVIANAGAIGRTAAYASKVCIVTVGPILLSMNGNTDYFELWSLQNSGGNLDTYAASNIAPMLQAIWVSPL